MPRMFPQPSLQAGHEFFDGSNLTPPKGLVKKKVHAIAFFS
jgi:hypothetical protein